MNGTILYLISPTLAIGRFDDSVGYGVYNLVESMIRIRRELCGENLSGLNLRHCTFDGVKLGEKGCGTSLKGSLLKETNILPVGHSDEVNSASYSPDGRFIISTSCDNTVKVWDASTFALVKTLQGHSSCVNSASYSPDGRYIVSASQDTSVLLQRLKVIRIRFTVRRLVQTVKKSSVHLDHLRMIRLL